MFNLRFGRESKITDEIQFRVERGQVPAFAATMALGQLAFVKHECIPAGDAIWSIAHPAFWEPLEEAGVLTGPILATIQTLDEISAIETLLPNDVSRIVDDLIAVLENALSDMPDTTWRLYTEKSQFVEPSAGGDAEDRAPQP